MKPRKYLFLAAIGLITMFSAVATASAQKYGGVLRAILAANPPSLSLQEEATNRTTWPMVPVYNNLVWYDLFKQKETFDTIRPDLAEGWTWSPDNTRLTFKLRQGVRWHDGKPFTSKDVKHTWDTVRGVSGKKMKLNPRKLWYFNVTDITTNGDYEVTFHLKRPQPSLLAMLAAGYSPVYPAHVPPRQLRTTPLGTGPFKMKAYRRDQMIALEKNQDYFVKGRPYLDGVEFPIIRSLSSQLAAMIAKQADVNMQLSTLKPARDTLAKANVGLAFSEFLTNTTFNIIVNTKKPPFNNPEIRKAVSLALDRQSLIRSVFGGGAVRGGAMIPAPWGVWGLNPEQLNRLPGYGDPEKNKAEAKRILAAQGYDQRNPLRFKVSARSFGAYVKSAVWATGELHKVGIEAELEQVDVAVWHGKVARRDFQFGMNGTAVGIDDPDAAFYENYKCGSQRNYSDYCNPELEKKYDLQSAQTNLEIRRKLVHEIDIKLQEDGARPMLVYRVDYYAHWPYVKNYIPHQSIYNAFRMQDIWLDK